MLIPPCGIKSSKHLYRQSPQKEKKEEKKTLPKLSVTQKKAPSNKKNQRSISVISIPIDWLIGICAYKFHKILVEERL